MTPRFFKSFILVNIFIIPTNLFEPFIRFFRKTSVITMATLLGQLSLRLPVVSLQLRVQQELEGRTGETDSEADEDDG